MFSAYDNWLTYDKDAERQPLAVAEDWQGRPIFDNDPDRYYKIGSDLIHETEIVDFVQEVYGMPVDIGGI